MPWHTFSQGPYAPGAGEAGTLAIHKDSSVFSGWCISANVERGYQQINEPSLGYSDLGDAASALGEPDGDVVSLGDGGQVVLEFAYPLYNGVGPDFAVFENSFSNTFLELAFVEVSSNGIDFVRFPSHSLTPVNQQTGPFDLMDPTNVHNLAGKYRATYGSPFDLDDLSDSSMLNLDQITHIRIVDVVGSIDSVWGSTDAYGNLINDPWPTAFGSGGFDLDAVGLIHQVGVPQGIKPESEPPCLLYVHDQKIHVQWRNAAKNLQLRVFDFRGALLFQGRLHAGMPMPYVGPVILQVYDDEHLWVKRLVIR